MNCVKDCSRKKYHTAELFISPEGTVQKDLPADRSIPHAAIQIYSTIINQRINTPQMLSSAQVKYTPGAFLIKIK